MRGLSIKKILELVGGALIGELSDAEKEISFITRDSREASEDCLYAAFYGERVDGHDFLEKCRESGAIIAICEHEVADTSLPYILVDSTQTALGKIASFYRGQFNIPVIGITGSVGKTSAKEMISTVLAERFNTLKTQGNYNNELGVPLTLFGLNDEHEVAVVEMGISDFGEMSRLTAMVRPTMSVITTIGHSHLEKLIDLDGVLRAKFEICESMGEDSLLILNGDDVKLKTADTHCKKQYFGKDQSCDIWAENVVSHDAQSIECDIFYAEQKLHVKINSFGEYLVYAALAAVAVGRSLGMTGEEMARGIAKYQPVGRRAKVVDTGYCTLIDDCYNANPSSVKSSLKSLKMLSGRRVCILGDMLELGEGEIELHKFIGNIAADCADFVITNGELAEYISAEAGKSIISIHFKNKSELMDKISDLLKKGDNILVKASRGMEFEEISEIIASLTL